MTADIENAFEDVSGVQVTVPFNGAIAGSIAITAAEGGIGYWSVIIGRYEYQRWSPDGLPENINVADTFVFYTIADSEDPDGERWQVTPAVIRKGIELFLAGVPGNFERRQFDDPFELDMMDSAEADSVIQLGLFGKLVYG